MIIHSGGKFDIYCSVCGNSYLNVDETTIKCKNCGNEIEKDNIQGE